MALGLIKYFTERTKYEKMMFSREAYVCECESGDLSQKQISRIRCHFQGLMKLHTSCFFLSSQFVFCLAWWWKNWIEGRKEKCKIINPALKMAMNSTPLLLTLIPWCECE